MKPIPLLLLFVFLLWNGISVSSANAQSGNEGAAEEKDWLEFYYENPTPDRFVGQMKDWAEDGTLANEYARPALIAFISQLIRQNRDSLRGWFNDLAGLEPSEKQVFYTGMLFSRTTEADELLKEMFGEAYEEQKKETPKILSLPLDKKQTIDMLWGFYYATGSEHAIRRLILSLRFVEAPDNPEGVDVPDGFDPLYKAIPEFAMNTIITNAERHPRIRKMVELFYEKDDTLVPAERNGLYTILSELDPENYPPKEEEGAAPDSAAEE